MNATGKRGAHAFAEQNGGDNRDCNRQRGAVRAGKLVEHFHDLLSRAAAAHVEPEHLAQHRDGNLDADTGQETDQHRTRQEIRQEAKPEQARDQQEPGGEQRHRANQRHVSRTGRGRDVVEAAREDCRRGRVRGDDEVPRRADRRERDQRQQQRVQPGDDVSPGDARVAQDLRNVHRGQGERRERVARHA